MRHAFAVFSVVFFVVVHPANRTGRRMFATRRRCGWIGIRQWVGVQCAILRASVLWQEPSIAIPPVPGGNPYRADLNCGGDVRHRYGHDHRVEPRGSLNATIDANEMAARMDEGPDPVGLDGDCDDGNARTEDTFLPTGCSKDPAPPSIVTMATGGGGGGDDSTAGDPASGCVNVADVVCDDGDACTIDSCDAVDGCIHTPSGGVAIPPRIQPCGHPRFLQDV